MAVTTHFRPKERGDPPGPWPPFDRRIENMVGMSDTPDGPLDMFIVSHGRAAENQAGSAVVLARMPRIVAEIEARFRASHRPPRNQELVKLAIRDIIRVCERIDRWAGRESGEGADRPASAGSVPVSANLETSACKSRANIDRYWSHPAGFPVRTVVACVWCFLQNLVLRSYLRGGRQF